MLSVAVVVCTRDRPDDLARALPATLVQQYPDFELIVVDQSTDDRSKSVVRAIIDPRMRYVRDNGKGLSRARNIGMRSTNAEVVVFTDDDCEPTPDWLARMVKYFATDPTVGIAFGTVLPAAHDQSAGFIDGYHPPQRQRLIGRLAKLSDGGIGASMAVRHANAEVVGPFDERLGAGGYFASGEDWDYAYRMLVAGHALAHVPEAVVLHHGFRPWTQGAALTRATYGAIAATWMKHVRAGDPVGLLLLSDAFFKAASEVAKNIIRRRTPTGLRRLTSLAAGMARSFELPVDKQRRIYRQA